MPSEAEFGKPSFRAEVPVGEFTKIEHFRDQIGVLDEIVTSPDDRIIGAELMQDIIVDPDAPNEVKLEAIKRAFDLISGYGNDATNVETARVLIDSIRSSRDSGMRVRLATVISHDLQDKYTVGSQHPPTTLRMLLDAVKRREAFELIARGPETDPAHKQWAEFLLRPRGVVEVFNELYERDRNLVLLPRVEEEVVDINEEGVPQDPVVEIPDAGKYTIIRLSPPRFWSREKREIYERHFDRPPSLYVTRLTGKKYIHVEFPEDLTAIADGDIMEFRAGMLPRNAVVNRWERELWPQYLARMNDEQRKEFLESIADNNIAIDFRTSTLRKEAVKDQPEEETELALGEEVA